MASLLVTAFLALTSSQLVSAQTEQTTWGAVVFTMYGDRTPLMTNPNPFLTPLGAAQLVLAGETIRTRYVQGPGSNVTTSFPIQGISKNMIDNSQLDMLSTDDEYIATSAQAFMQGLYPPLGVDQVNSASILANGSLLQYPLGGYQYPEISSISALDFNYIWLAGEAECSAYELSQFQYFGSEDYTITSSNSASFYQSLIPLVFDGIIPAPQVTYYNAYNLWDYANYQFIHNSTVAENLTSGALAHMYYLASHSEFALNGNLSASGQTNGDQIRAIAGKTFAGRVLTSLGQNIGSDGADQKLSLFFGSFETFLAFFSLSGLSKVNPVFQMIPLPGSVMAFELFSNSANETIMPNNSELRVRFMFRNGTDESAAFQSYALFGLGNSQSDMTWTDFQTLMGGIALEDIGTWCTTCNSLAIFCPAFTESETNNGTISGGGSSSETSSSSRSAISAPVAGVIGAAVTIAVLGSILLLAILVGGLRVHRHSKADRRATTSSFGGFKGAEKLASDQDLTLSKGGAGAVVRHERVGSWELGGTNKGMDEEAGGAAQGAEVAKIDRVVSGADYSAAHDRDEDPISPFADPVKVDDRI